MIIRKANNIRLKPKLNTNEGDKVTIILFHLIILLLVYVGIRLSHVRLYHVVFS